jgi:uncharacterized protein (UPF0332 family)
MDSMDFLNFAKDLLKNDKPINYRTAINRSYYAAYHVAVNLLEKSDVPIPKSGSGHGVVRRYLGNCGIKVIEEAQSKLSNLYSDRIKADYKLTNKAVEKKANAIKAIYSSENIITTFDKYNSKGNRKKMSEGIKDYLQKINPS